MDSDGNVLSENEIVVDETEGETAVEDEESAVSVETAEGEDEASDEANVEADTETEADAESDEEIVEDGNSTSSKRFYIVGGIILAVGIAFYVFLSIKKKRNNLNFAKIFIEREDRLWTQLSQFSAEQPFSLYLS